MVPSSAFCSARNSERQMENSILGLHKKQLNKWSTVLGGSLSTLLIDSSLGFFLFKMKKKPQNEKGRKVGIKHNLMLLICLTPNIIALHC